MDRQGHFTHERTHLICTHELNRVTINMNTGRKQYTVTPMTMGTSAVPHDTLVLPATSLTNTRHSVMITPTSNQKQRASLNTSAHIVVSSSSLSAPDGTICLDLGL